MAMAMAMVVVAVPAVPIPPAPSDARSLNQQPANEKIHHESNDNDQTQHQSIHLNLLDRAARLPTRAAQRRRTPRADKLAATRTARSARSPEWLQCRSGTSDHIVDRGGDRRHKPQHLFPALGNICTNNSSKKSLMKTMTTINPNSNQSTPILWIPLPECQQELLSGGAPRQNGGGGGNGNGGGGGGGGTGGRSDNAVGGGDTGNKTPLMSWSVE
jgi:hypothetical protein